MLLGCPNWLRFEKRLGLIIRILVGLGMLGDETNR